MQSQQREDGRHTALMRKRKRRPFRVGRPPQKRAGEVEGRILDAAQRVFLEGGLRGASIDEIAGLARAGKPTIYARFANKEALFAGVVMRDVEANIARFESPSVGGRTIEERLANVGAALLHEVLSGHTVGLMRLVIAEAQRFPDLASSVHNMARKRGTEAVARLVAEVAQSDALGRFPAFAPDHLEATTRFFIDLVLFPILFRALFGEKVAVLHAQIRPHVARSVSLFLAACRERVLD
jgi:AcrR family transcriptional regulator